MDKVLELNKILDEEIKFCEGFESILMHKKELLSHSKAMELKAFDEKIYLAHEKLISLKDARKNILKNWGNGNNTLSEIINEIENKAAARELELKRKKIQTSVYKITILNKVINSLIEHSLKMIDGTISSIAKATMATQTKGDYYNKNGQKQQQELQTLSAIIRDA